MLYLPQAELDVIQPGLLRVFARSGHHLGSHVHADHPPGRSHGPRSQKAVETAPRAQVQHHLSGLQVGYRLRIPAAQTQIGPLRRQGEFLLAVAKASGDLIRDPRRDRNSDEPLRSTMNPFSRSPRNGRARRRGRCQCLC